MLLVFSVVFYFSFRILNFVAIFSTVSMQWPLIWVIKHAAGFGCAFAGWETCAPSPERINWMYWSVFKVNDVWILLTGDISFFLCNHKLSRGFGLHGGNQIQFNQTIFPETPLEQPVAEASKLAGILQTLATSELPKYILFLFGSWYVYYVSWLISYNVCLCLYAKP